MLIRCCTRFDITATGVKNNFQKNRESASDAAQWNHRRNQQRNWETINQIISLRTLPVNITTPQRRDDSWEFEFEIEQPATVELAGDPVGLLNADCRDVPMLTGLDEQPGTASVLIPGINIEFVVILDK
jgi:hypothetical protein